MSSVVTNFLLIFSCDFLDLFKGGIKLGSLGLFSWKIPQDGSECTAFAEDSEIEDTAFNCARVCSVIALCAGGIMFAFGFFKQCIFPLPCTQMLMDLSSTCVQVMLALVYVIWLSEACDLYTCKYGDGSTLLIVTQLLWLAAGIFSRCMRPGRWERRDEIHANRDKKKAEQQLAKEKQEKEKQADEDEDAEAP